MIEREIPKDIKGYEPKFIGPLTFRQTVCMGLAAAVSVPTGLLLGQIFINEIAITVAGALAIPFVACGFKKVYGIPLEKFAMMYLRTQILVPKNRKYQTNNYYRKLFGSDVHKMDSKELKKYQKRKKKELKELGHDFDVLR